MKTNPGCYKTILSAPEQGVYRESRSNYTVENDQPIDKDRLHLCISNLKSNQVGPTVKECSFLLKNPWYLNEVDQQAFEVIFYSALNLSNYPLADLCLRLLSKQIPKDIAQQFCKVDFSSYVRFFSDFATPSTFYTHLIKLLSLSTCCVRRLEEQGLFTALFVIKGLDTMTDEEISCILSVLMAVVTTEASDSQNIRIVEHSIHFCSSLIAKKTHLLEVFRLVNRVIQIFPFDLSFLAPQIVQCYSNEDIRLAIEVTECIKAMCSQITQNSCLIQVMEDISFPSICSGIIEHAPTEVRSNIWSALGFLIQGSKEMANISASCGLIQMAMNSIGSASYEEKESIGFFVQHMSIQLA